MLLPDFSQWQSTGKPDWVPTPDFADIKRLNGGAAIIRVSHGLNHRDHCFTRNRRAAQRHEYAFLGLYHFATPGDIAAQARAFCRWVGKLAPNEIPIVDIERGSGDQSSRAEKWFRIVDSKLGLSHLPLRKRSWLYSGESFLTTQLGGVRASGRNIWVAAYRRKEPTLDHILWQSTDGGKHGIHKIGWPGAGKCDTNLFHGSLKQLVTVISRDDLPYPMKQITQMVKDGVAAELNTELGDSGITPAQGAKAAVQTHQDLEQLRQTVDALAAFVHTHLPGPPAPADGPAPNSGTPGRRAGTRTATSPTT
jgi:GH25 family lysozyme M1 (1,4-beta-N-acetylmuramidase)